MTNSQALRPVDAVPALSTAGLIQPFDECLQGVIEDQIPAARSVGLVDGERYGISGNLDLKVMAFDRAAFRRAGLDPTKPPSTLTEFEAAARTIRDNEGPESPVAGLTPIVNLWDQNELDDDPPRGATMFSRLLVDHLLITPDPMTEAPPLLDGTSTIHIVNQSELWGYTAELAAGPSSMELGVAAIPGSTDPFVPIGRDVWVLGARADPAQTKAANAFAAWLLDDDQQAAFHQMTDLFPSNAGAPSNGVNAEYWSELPLLLEAWKIAATFATPAPDWLSVPGAAAAVQADLLQTTRLSDAESDWAALTHVIDAAATTTKPGELLDCLYGSDGPPKPITSCATVIDG